MNSMDDFHENSAPPASLVKRKSAFGIGDLANHPLLKSLPPHQREVILANAKNADIDGDGDLTRDEWLCARKFLLLYSRQTYFYLLLPSLANLTSRGAR